MKKPRVILVAGLGLGLELEGIVTERIGFLGFTFC